MATKSDFEKEEEIQPSPVIASETSSQLDDEYELYKKNQGVEIDPAEAKKTLRKIDFRIVPILFFTYLLQYLDKNGINYANAFDLQKGTNLKGQDYSWLGTYCLYIPMNSIDEDIQGSIFYFGYLLGQGPSGYLLQRLPIAKFLGCATLGELVPRSLKASYFLSAF
jgi:hypothetical protein